VLAGCVGALGVLCLAWLSLLDQSRDRLTKEADNYIASFNRLMGEVDAALAELNADPPEVCTRQTLLRMRRAMVEHPGVDDMMFFPLGAQVPSCSANLGRSHEFTALPAPLVTPFARNQRQYWDNVPLDLFDGTVRGSVLKEGRIAVVTNFRRYIFYPKDGVWEVYMPRPDGGFGLYSGGTPGLYARYAGARDNLLTRGLYAHQCSTTAVACVTIHLPVREMLALKGPWLVLIPLRALVVAGLAFFLVHHWLARRGTERGRIRVALRRKAGFTCLYQPIVDIGTGEPLGCEVLARFEDEFGPLPPDVFVPIVEGLDGTWNFTSIIMEIAFRELAPLLARRPDFGVSVNFYPRDLTAARIPRLARCPVLNDVAARGYKLHFEVIETAFGDLDSLSETIDHLHSRGFLISIDDFGTGSANLEQVQRLKADFVKIDRSFMRGLEPSSTSIRASLVPQIVEIARKVDVSLIAEGIETPEQVQILKKLGVRLGQGYHFARPMDVEALTHYVHAAEADLLPDALTVLPSIA